MGSIVKKVIHASDSVRDKIDPFRGGDAILEGAGLKTLTGTGSNNIFDNGATAAAEAAARAAAQQSQATKAAADTQAAAVRDSSTQQSALLRDQASAAVSAQTAAINQSAQAAQLAAQQAAQPQEGTPDVQLNGYGDSSDPRRRYQGGGAPAIGGTSGGVGIRI